ncbi:MAG: transcription initiation factor IIB family protein [Candidatus Lokiarchaeota archaeon]|nr:transcription initiation factor IIB family protein [Candidatus Lokiarchaeota archaeon]MCK4382432.1 transcription initiation factor IIB family protein [Candidatus Lokiarchaeota archaeon]
MVVEVIPQSNFCPECGGGTISIQQRGETVCKQCGLVVNEKEVDIFHSGIRAYSKQEKDKKERTGCPISILMPDIGLSTIIDRTKIKNPDLRRAAKWNTHLTWEKRNMLIAITELKRIGGNLNFPERVKKAAVRLYKEVFKKNLLRGRSINGMIAACAYYVCKKERVPITLQEILGEASINDNIVKKCYKILVRELNLKSPHIDPVALIPRYCADLGLDIHIEKEAIKVLKNFIANTSICGKDPKGLCAGSIYLVAKLKNKKISQKDISKVIGVTEVTLRSRYKEFLQHISFNFHTN